MYSAVAILERMDVDESECQNRSRQHRIEFPCRRPVEGDQAIDEIRQILRPRAYVVRDWLLGVPIPAADKSSFVPETEMHEARIADHDLLQAEQFVEVQRLRARLTDRAAPALDAVLRGAFAFDDEARLGVLEQQERRGARHQILRHRSVGFSCN